MLRSSSPALNEKTFAPYGRAADHEVMGEAMSMDGTIAKTALLIFLAVASATFTWTKAVDAIPFGTESVGEAFAAVRPWILGGAIGGFVLAMIIVFKKTAAPVLAPAYAVLEGLMLGGLSALFELSYPGIAINAVLLTMGTLAVMLIAYRMGVIRATQRFKACVFAATGAIFLVYLISMVMGFFGSGIPYIHDSGAIGIGFSVFVVGIAALNLILDFDLIEKGVEHGAPKYMEWYASFALLVTLVWLYLEILRLLSKLRSRD